MHRRADRRAILAGAETLVPASENGFSQKEAPLVEENGLLERLRAPNIQPIVLARLGFVRLKGGEGAG